ncbi:MAG: hypothetical protein IJY70_00175 [Clostridia bacterium]|nr:hypothetical protein [Clostridia bacterium]
MKRKKSLLAGLCALTLATSVGVSAVPFNFASAATATLGEFEIDTVQNEVEYGETFSVPTATGYTASVIAPNGKVVVLSGSTVTADQIGFYTVTYTNDSDASLKYSFNVYCTTAHTYQLVIDNEAKIPTYVATGATKVLPSAKVGYYEDGEFVEATGSTVTVKTDDGTTVDLVNGYEFTNAGSTFVTYTANVGAGQKYISKTFEIKVQDDFEDTKAPTLTVTGVPKSGNVNMEVVLPVASTSDTYDSKVDVVVTVEYKDGDTLTPVKKVKVNDEGIVSEVLTDNEVFDNGDNMSFYPTEVGEYKVTYKAVDDNNNESSPWVYTVSVSDKKAPTMVVDDTRIPANWGYNSVKKLVNNSDASQGTEALSSTALTFYTPEFFDNYDEKDEVVLEFKLKDPESNTVVSFSNINKAAGESTTIADVEWATEDLKFSKTENLVIDLAEYVTYKADTANYQVEGTYTAIYAAQDKAGNRVQRSYTINLKPEFVDDKPVSVSYKAYEKSVVASEIKEVEYVVPAIIATSGADTKLFVEYKVVSDTAEVKVSQGEILTVKKDGSDYKLVAKEGEIVITANAFHFEATATSDAGNTATVESDEVKVIVPGTASAPTVNVSGATDLDNLDNAENTHILNNMMVKVTGVADFDAVSVEVSVTDNEGKDLPIKATVYNVANTIVVKNFEFTASKADTNYLFTVRVFDINGNSVVKQYSFDIDQATEDDPSLDLSATLNATSANTKAEIKFAKKAADYNNEGVLNGSGKYLTAVNESDYKLVLARDISGGTFSVNANGITAYNAGRYSVADKFVMVSASDVAVDFYDTFALASQDDADAFYAFLKAKTTSNAVQVKDGSTVQLEVQGEMPSYSELSTATEEKWVKIPVVAGFSQNEPANKITLEIKSPKGLTVEPTLCDTTEQDNGYQYKFKPTENGTYTLTYKVKVGEKDEATFVYTVKAGDLVLPVITMTGTHSATMKAGDTFTFLALTATDNKTTDSSKFTVTKTLYGPDGAVVGTSISGEYNTNAGKTTSTTLSASGKYTVKYTVKDEAGNTAVKEYDITVTGASSNSGISLATLSTIMIIVGVLLIAGVVAYLFIFRRPKKKD